jgi:hypothetical protein
MNWKDALGDVRGKIKKHPRLPPKNPPDQSGAYDWAFTAVGHWMVTARAQGRLAAEPVYKCVSRCGFMAVFRASVLADGATKSCDLCRRGAPPAAADRTYPAGLFDKLLSIWGPYVSFAIPAQALVTTNVNVRHEAADDWDQFGQAALIAFLDRTPYGRDFGWRAFVRDCHRARNASQRKDPVRVRAFRGPRQWELTVAGNAYTFDIDLNTGRTDVKPQDLNEAVARAAGVIPADPPPGGPPPAPPPPADLAALVAGLAADEGKIRAGLDRLLGLARDSRAGADMVGELEAAAAAARAQAGPLAAAHAEAVAWDEDRQAAAAQAARAAARAEEEFRAAVRVRDMRAAEAAEARDAREAARARHEPAKTALAAAEAQLEEARRLAEDRAAALARAGAAAALLQALGRLAD